MSSCAPAHSQSDPTPNRSQPSIPGRTSTVQSTGSTDTSHEYRMLAEVEDHWHKPGCWRRLTSGCWRTPPLRTKTIRVDGSAEDQTPRDRFGRSGEELLGHLAGLWWPELLLSPGFFYTGYHNMSIIPVAVALSCFLAIGLGKYNALYHVRQLLEAATEILNDPAEWIPPDKTKFMPGKGQELEDAMHQEMDGSDKVPLLGCELPWRKLVRTYTKSLPNCVEMLLSCNAAGASWLAWQGNDEAQRTWFYSWTPIVGRWLAGHSSLPIVLTVLLVISIGFHIRGFTARSKEAATLLDDLADLEKVPRGFLVFQTISKFLVAVTAAADSANLLLISNVTFAASWSISGAGGKGRDRTTRFMLKVGPLAGNAPGLWFKVSALEHLYDRLGPGGRFSTILAIAMVLYSTIEPLWDQFIYLKTFPWRFAGRPNNPTREHFYLSLVSLIVSMIIIFFSVVRLAGVWYCSSHIFQISQGGCYA